jgi:hypothetical protein
MKILAANEEQFLTDAKGKRTGAVLDLQAYERLLEAKEELADIRAYDSTCDSKSLCHRESLRPDSARVQGELLSSATQ